MRWRLTFTTAVLALFHSRVSKIRVHRGCGTVHATSHSAETESRVRGGPALLITKLMMTYAAFTWYYMCDPKHNNQVGLRE